MPKQAAVEEQAPQAPAANPGGVEPAGGTVPKPEPPSDAEERLKAERVQEE